MTKHEIDFIMCARPGILQDVEVLGKVRCSDHSVVRYQSSRDLRREKKRLVRKKPIQWVRLKKKHRALREKIEQLRIALKNQYLALTEQSDISVEAMNDNLTGITTESAIAVGSKMVRQDTGQLLQDTKDLIKKRRRLSL